MTLQMQNPRADKATGAAAKQNNYQHRVDIIPELSARLKKFKRLSEGRYTACCPVHNDRNPSLGITLKPDGKWVMNCLSCGANGQAVCDALGIDVTALFPPSDNPRYERQTRSGFSAWQLLHALEPDLVRLLIVANELKENQAISPDDRDFVAGLILRINDGLEYLEGRKK
jgi:hypothetical protein